MSYYTGTTPASAYKPQAQVRVEGFHMPSPGTPPGSSGTNNSAGSNNGASTTSNGGNLNDLFPHSFLPDAFRKFPPPAGSGEGSHDFNDDLVSLIGDRNGGAAGTGGGGGSGGGGGNTGASAGGGSGGAYEEGYHRPHNIFDVSSPIPVNSNHPNGAHNGPGSQPSSLHSPSTSLHDYQHHPPPHFNSTLPALNSSMRYEPPPENNPLTPSSPNVPPSSYHAPHNGFTRHTPSPSHSHPGSIPIDGRSRSRSRPPSSGAAGPGSATSAAMNALNSGGVGPARTTRPRRGSSISGTSPPPLHGRPHAIVIPGGGRPSHSNVVGSPMSPSAGPGSNPWFMANGQTQNSTDYLPTPESLGSHPSIHSSMSSHHHSHSQSQSGYGHFSLSPPPQSSTNTGSDLSHHLPPLHHMAHSLPKSPMEQHVPHPTHQHHLSGSGMPKSPLDHPYPSSYGFGSGNVNGTGGGSPPGASPGSLPNGMGSGLGNGSMGAGGVTPTPSSYGMSNMGMNMNMAGLPGSAPSGGIQPPQAIISGGTPASAAALSASDKQALLANEKRRRRRESHNAVERRRRDNINEKISELATLIPECMLEGAGPPNAKDTGVSITPPLTEDALVPKPKEESLKQEKDEDGTIPPSGTQEGGTVVKANKGMILRKSVEYIRYLQQLVTAQGARNRELEQELRKFRGSSVSSDSPSSNSGEGGANPDDADGDDSMSLGMGGEEMVLHDEIVGSPTLTAATATAAATTTTTATNGGATAAPAAPPARKGHHKHSSSTSRPKPPRLPSMPEEDMEVDKMSNAGDVANDGESLSPGSSTNEGGNSGDAEDQERGRTRGVRGVHGQGGGAQGQQGQGMGTGVNGSMKEEMLDEGGDHSMGAMDNMFGMMNGHHGHHQMNHHQQQVMGW